MSPTTLDRDGSSPGSGSSRPVSVTGPHQRLVLPHKPVRPFAVAIGGAAGPLLALCLGQSTVLGPGDATGAVGAALAIGVGLLAVFAIAELVSAYPSDEGTLLPIGRAFGPRVTVAAWVAAIVAALLIAGAASIAAVAAGGVAGAAAGSSGGDSLGALGVASGALVVAWAASRFARGAGSHVTLAAILLVVGFLLLTGLLVDIWESHRFVATLERLPGLPPLTMATTAAIGVLAPLIFQEGAAQVATSTGRPAFVAPRATAGGGLLVLLFGAASWVVRGGVTPHGAISGPVASLLIAGCFVYVAVRAVQLAARLLDRLVERRWLARLPARLVPLLVLPLVAIATQVQRASAARLLLGAAAFALLLFFAGVFAALARLRRLDPLAPRQLRAAPTVRGRALATPLGLVGVAVIGAGVLIAMPLAAALAMGSFTLAFALGLVKTPGTLPAEQRETTHYELLKRAGEPVLAQQYRAALERGERA